MQPANDSEDQPTLRPTLNSHMRVEAGLSPHGNQSDSFHDTKGFSYGTIRGPYLDDDGSLLVTNGGTAILPGNGGFDFDPSNAFNTTHLLPGGGAGGLIPGNGHLGGNSITDFDFAPLYDVNHAFGLQDYGANYNAPDINYGGNFNPFDSHGLGNTRPAVVLPDYLYDFGVNNGTDMFADNVLLDPFFSTHVTPMPADNGILAMPGPNPFAADFSAAGNDIPGAGYMMTPVVHQAGNQVLDARVAQVAHQASNPISGQEDQPINGRWPCRTPGSACPKTFSRQADRNRHEQTVHGNVRRHFCPRAGCDKGVGNVGGFAGYKRMDKVKRHLKKSH